MSFWRRDGYSKKFKDEQELNRQRQIDQKKIKKRLVDEINESFEEAITKLKKVQNGQ